MPETLTERMARFKRAQAAGDLDAAARIAAEARHQARPAVPVPTGYSLTPTQATFPELAKLDQMGYAAICADVTRLENQNRVLKGELQQASQRGYDAERRLGQVLAKLAALEATGESSDQE